MAYVDGFVVPIPKNNMDAYREMAKKAGALWREHGALELSALSSAGASNGAIRIPPRTRSASPGCSPRGRISPEDRPLAKRRASLAGTALLGGVDVDGSDPVHMIPFVVVEPVRFREFHDLHAGADGDASDVVVVRDVNGG